MLKTLRLSYECECEGEVECEGTIAFNATLFSCPIISSPLQLPLNSQLLMSQNSAEAKHPNKSNKSIDNRNFVSACKRYSDNLSSQCVAQGRTAYSVADKLKLISQGI